MRRFVWGFYENVESDFRGLGCVLGDVDVLVGGSYVEGVVY